MTVGMNETQADIVNDGLNSLHMGLNARKGILIASVILVFISGVLSVGLFFRWRTIAQEMVTDSGAYERAKGLNPAHLQGDYANMSS